MQTGRETYHRSYPMQRVNLPTGNILREHLLLSIAVPHPQVEVQRLLLGRMTTPCGVSVSLMTQGAHIFAEKGERTSGRSLDLAVGNPDMGCVASGLPLDLHEPRKRPAGARGVRGGIISNQIDDVGSYAPIIRRCLTAFMVGYLLGLGLPLPTFPL